MEQRPRGCAAVAAALLLVLLGARAQGGTRSPRCDCAGDFHKKIGLFCCRGCPAASQVALENCSAVADTRCGCKPGWFVECQVSQCVSSSPFYCQPCLDCGALHRHTRLLCSRRDTDCGTCLPGFYEHGDGCVSCPT
ncbi:TNFRSF25 isoform 12 [Pan troglodytes]|nr:lymphocyte associated receptor of death 5 [Homo sapiens]KAI2514827.1 TNF receptor superfamily member 25 [Homo sapiens]KAI4078394.1 TNF receptor superfamily member 25 [Homo sapiens]PNI39937.1 TNFRSF25 isoform 12 [Pan troglodytes]